jgi:hypothetical protein
VRWQDAIELEGQRDQQPQHCSGHRTGRDPDPVQCGVGSEVVDESEAGKSSRRAVPPDPANRRRSNP